MPHGIAFPVGLYTVSIVLALVGSVIELVAGIIGVKNWNKLEKAATCVLWGIIVVAVFVVSEIITIVAYPEGFSVISLVSGLVIPALYLVGAFQNKKALETAPAAPIAQ